MPTQVQDEQVSAATAVVDTAYVPRTAMVSIVIAATEVTQGSAFVELVPVSDQTIVATITVAGELGRELQVGTYAVTEGMPFVFDMSTVVGVQGTNDVVAMDAYVLSTSGLFLATTALAVVFVLLVTAFRRNSDDVFVGLSFAQCVIATLGRLRGTMMIRIREVQGTRRLVPGAGTVAIAAVIAVLLLLSGPVASAHAGAGLLVEQGTSPWLALSLGIFALAMLAGARVLTRRAR